MWCKSQGLYFSNEYPVPVSFLVNPIISSLDYLAPCPKSNWPSTCGSLSGLYSVSLIYMSIFTPIPPCLDYYSFRVNFNIRLCNSSTLLSFKCFGMLGLLHFCVNFRIINFYKNLLEFLLVFPCIYRSIKERTDITKILSFWVLSTICHATNLGLNFSQKTVFCYFYRS